MNEKLEEARIFIEKSNNLANDFIGNHSDNFICYGGVELSIGI